MNTNAMLRFTRQARLVLSLAQEEARRSGAAEITPLHLLTALVNVGGINQVVFVEAGIERSRVYALLGLEAVARPENADPLYHPDLSDPLKHILELSVDEVRRLRHHTINTPHLFLGLLRVHDEELNRIFAALELTPDQLRERILRSFDTSNN